MERFLQLAADDPQQIPGTTTAHLRAMDEAFNFVDADGSGSLDMLELEQALNYFIEQRELPRTVNRLALQQTFARLDTNGDGLISRDEWRRTMQRWMLSDPELEHNLTVVNCTLPSQYFHALRRQLTRSTPLVVAAPKGLLKHRPCVSAVDELLPGTHFRSVLPDTLASEPVTHVLLCSGQVYWVLHRVLRAHKVRHVAVVRLEQISPFPYGCLADELTLHYPHATWHWVQEEHKNMGAWSYVQPRFDTLQRALQGPELAWKTNGPQTASQPSLQYIGRPASPCATGSFSLHMQETQEWVLGPCLALAGH